MARISITLEGSTLSKAAAASRYELPDQTKGLTDSHAIETALTTYLTNITANHARVIVPRHDKFAAEQVLASAQAAYTDAINELLQQMDTADRAIRDEFATL